ncbi:hypothetical protein GQ53DRAFT_745971 [Thozetella sp. PMI_491]|nr:hypothetical protein GQ53DRAFT_745971 [Thozetella sp. PMI_491]
MAEQQPPPLMKFSVCLYKKDDVSYDDFIKWSTEVYPVKVIPIMKRHGLLKWTETTYPPQLRELFRGALKTQLNRPNWTVPDYDLAMTYWIRGPEAMGPLTQDPDWLELEKEALTKANMEIGHFVVGYEIVQFDTGEVPGPINP